MPSITAHLSEGLASAFYHLLLSLSWDWVALTELKMSRTKEIKMREFPILEHTVICTINSSHSGEKHMLWHPGLHRTHTIHPLKLQDFLQFVDSIKFMAAGAA